MIPLSERRTMDVKKTALNVAGAALILGGAVLVFRFLPSRKHVAEPDPPVATSDLVLRKGVTTEQVLLKQTFTVQKNKIFRFEIPAHVTHPRIQGSFQSFTGNADKTSADVELMLMDDPQYQDFLKGKLQETVNTITPSSNAEIHWQLDSTSDMPQPYYFVFLNPQKIPASVSVQTDFNLSSE